MLIYGVNFGCLAHMVLRRLVEGMSSRKLPAVLTFIDFKKAFDIVQCGKMLKILSAYNCITQTIKDSISDKFMYVGTKAKVFSPDHESEFFEILAGV